VAAGGRKIRVGGGAPALYREVSGLDGSAIQMGRELRIDGLAGEWNGGLASPRAHQLALGEETPLLSVKLSAKPVSSKKSCVLLIKIVNRSEIFPTLNMTLDMLCIAYKKVVVVKLKFKFL
jgi:hypothetical protein